MNRQPEARRMGVAPDRRNERGFTLAELLISVLVFIAMAAAAIYVIHFTSILGASAYIDIHREARMAMESMTRDIRWAVSIPSSHLAHYTSDSCLVLELPTMDAAGNVTNLNAPYDYIVYRLTGDQNDELQRLVYADGTSSRGSGTRTVAEFITSLVFRSSDGTGFSSVAVPADEEIVDIELETGKTTASTSQSDKLRSSVKLRNK